MAFSTRQNEAQDIGSTIRDKGAISLRDYVLVETDAIDKPSILLRRTEMVPDELFALRVSINENDLLHPILVKSIGPDRLAPVAGIHRLEAFRLNALQFSGNQDIPAIPNLKNRYDGWTRIPAKIVAGNALNPLKECVLVLTENYSRKDLHPLDLCAALIEVKEHYNKEYPETKVGGRRSPESGERATPFAEWISGQLGIRPQKVYELLSLQYLSDEEKDCFRLGELTYSGALELVKPRKPNKKGPNKQQTNQNSQNDSLEPQPENDVRGGNTEPSSTPEKTDGDPTQTQLERTPQNDDPTTKTNKSCTESKKADEHNTDDTNSTKPKAGLPAPVRLRWPPKGKL